MPWLYKLLVSPTLVSRECSVLFEMNRLVVLGVAQLQSLFRVVLYLILILTLAKCGSVIFVGALHDCLILVGRVPIWYIAVKCGPEIGEPLLKHWEFALLMMLVHGKRLVLISLWKWLFQVSDCWEQRALVKHWYILALVIPGLSWYVMILFIIFLYFLSILVLL